MAENAQHTDFLIVLSGPTGAGKSALVQGLRELDHRLYFCVTATTRAPRPGEQDGVAYHFLTPAEFTRRIAAGGFLEWARVPPPDGPFYGTPTTELDRAFAEGRDAFLQVDVQGAASVRAAMPAAVTIFLRPPTVDALKGRVRTRGTEAEAEMERRLENARAELAREREFDYVVINEDGRLEDAVARVSEIISVERARAAAPGGPTSPREGRKE